MRFRAAIMIGLLLALAGFASAAEETPLLVHSPTVSRTQVVFAYGGYLWSVARDGGDARQLSTGGHEGLPVFSPDGKWIAFTAQYDGNADVYVMPAEGGEPRRLTWHPAADIAVGWTPDGKSVLFHSARDAYADFDRLYTVPPRRALSSPKARPTCAPMFLPAPTAPRRTMPTPRLQATASKFTHATRCAITKA